MAGKYVGSEAAKNDPKDVSLKPPLRLLSKITLKVKATLAKAFRNVSKYRNM
jgi:hypothetical protein